MRVCLKCHPKHFCSEFWELFGTNRSGCWTLPLLGPGPWGYNLGSTPTPTRLCGVCSFPAVGGPAKWMGVAPDCFRAPLAVRFAATPIKLRAGSQGTGKLSRKCGSKVLPTPLGFCAWAGFPERNPVQFLSSLDNGTLPFFSSSHPGRSPVSNRRFPAWSQSTESSFARDASR